MNTTSKIQLKSGFVSGFLPKNVNYTNYSMIVAIANYSNNVNTSHKCKILASEDVNLEDKERIIEGCGGFLYAVLFESFAKAFSRADSSNRKALIEALSNNEIDLINDL